MKQNTKILLVFGTGLLVAIAAWGADAFLGGRAKLTTIHPTTNYAVIVMGDSTAAPYRNMNISNMFESMKTLPNFPLNTTNYVAASVTYAKIQNVSATDRILGRDTAGAGVIEELTVTGGLEFTGTGIQRSALTGDVTASAGNNATTVANDAVTYAKMQNVSAASKLVGRGSAGGAGDPEEITLGTGLSMAGTTLSATAGGTGNVIGPPSSTALTLPGFTDTTGLLLTNSSITLSAARDALTVPGGVTDNGLAIYNGGLNYPPFALATDFVDGRTNTQNRTISANTTLHLTNFVIGSYVVLDIVQDATGTRTLAIDSTNTLVWRNSTNQTASISINTNATYRSVYTLFKPTATVVVIGGPDTAPDPREVDLAKIAITFGFTGTGGFVQSNGPTINNLTLSGTTLDATTAGITLKAKGYIVLTHPHIFDGVGALMVTNTTSITNGQAIFANGADASTNAVKYVLTVPEDIDTAVDLRAKFKFRLGGADTGTHRYVLSMISVADSAVYDGTVGNAVNLDFAGDGSGASGDVETVGFSTLTNWKSNLTAGQHWVIQLARDGDTSDSSTVNSTSGTLVIEYGYTQ